MTDVPQVTLPYEMPDTLDLSTLPSEVLKASTVEALIGQSEDLSARLRVALRRMSNLEEQLTVLHKDVFKFRRENEILTDKLSVEDDKEARWQKKLAAAEEDNHNLSLQLQNVRNLWAHEREENQQKISTLEAQLSHVYVKIQSITKYRARMRPLVKDLRHQARSALQQSNQMRLQLTEARERIQMLVDRLQGQGTDYHQHIQALSKTYEDKITEVIFDANIEKEHITSSFNEHISALNVSNSELAIKLADVESENSLLQEKCATLKEQFLHQVEIENRIHALQKELQDAQAWREAAENKSRENSSLLRQLQTNTHENQRLSSENQALKKQVENLQVLWDQNRTTIEDLVAREEHLQRVNQSLAEQLQKARQAQTAPRNQEIISSIDEQLTQILHSRHTLGGPSQPENAS